METDLEIMLEQDPVEGRQRETNGDKPGIMLEQDPVEGRQRETNGDRPGNHVGTKSVSLQELRTPSAEAVWGTIKTPEKTTKTLEKIPGNSKKLTKPNHPNTRLSCANKGAEEATDAAKRSG